MLTTADAILRRLKQGGFETWKSIETELGIDKSNFKELVGWYETDTYSRPVSELLKEGYKKVYIKPVITIMDGRVEDEKFVAYAKESLLTLMLETIASFNTISCWKLLQVLTPFRIERRIKI